MSPCSSLTRTWHCMRLRWKKHSCSVPRQSIKRHCTSYIPIAVLCYDSLSKGQSVPWLEHSEEYEREGEDSVSRKTRAATDCTDLPFILIRNYGRSRHSWRLFVKDTMKQMILNDFLHGTFIGIPCELHWSLLYVPRGNYKLEKGERGNLVWFVRWRETRGNGESGRRKVWCD